MKRTEQQGRRENQINAWPRLHIRNFGPLARLDMEIRRMNVLIGPQASGKSTAAKLVDFFLLVTPALRSALADAGSSPEKRYEFFIKTLRTLLRSIFGPCEQQKGLVAKWLFRTGNRVRPDYIEVFQSSTKADEILLDVRFSPRLKKDIEDALAKMAKEQKPRLVDFNSFIESAISEAKDKSSALAKKIFGGYPQPVFVPAGRANFDLRLKEQEISWLDSFRLATRYIRNTYGNGLEAPEKMASKLNMKQPDRKLASIARQLITSVLRGEYRSVKDAEFILSNGVKVPLRFSSSGQQEALWMLLMAYDLIIRREDVFAIFEEPEAHLFPEAQYDLVKLYAVLLRANTRNGILLTTHSPYILVAINNLIAAGQEGIKNKEAIEKIIPPEVWLNSSEISAYILSHAGEAKEIIEPELQQIRAEEIDSASAIMNRDYDSIMDAGDGNET